MSGVAKLLGDEGDFFGESVGTGGEQVFFLMHLRVGVFFISAF